MFYIAHLPERLPPRQTTQCSRACRSSYVAIAYSCIFLSAASAPTQERQAATADVKVDEQAVVEAARAALHTPVAAHSHAPLGRSGAERRCLKFAVGNEWYVVKEARSLEAADVEACNILQHEERYAPYLYGTLVRFHLTSPIVCVDRAM